MSPEILIDRGEWTEAETLLLETLPLWRASHYRYYLGACLLFLGRVSLRLGRLDEAVLRLEEARTNFVQVGADEQLPLVDARVAECRVNAANTDAALEIVRDLLLRAKSSTGVSRVLSLLERVRAHALLQAGDLGDARDALKASLAAARERHDLFEQTLTMLSLIELDRLEGVEPPREIVRETHSYSPVSRYGRCHPYRCPWRRVVPKESGPGGPLETPMTLVAVTASW